jgi:hypothetical protein
MSKRILVITAIFVFVAGFVFALGKTVTVTAAPGAQTGETSYLDEVSEKTGLVAAPTATSPECVYDNGYGLYLCPPAAPTVPPERDPAAAARALELLGSTGLLLIPDSGGDRVMAFDPTTGDLVDADFIPTDSDHLVTPKNAILSAAGNTILVSEQVQDVVHEYDLDGNYIGIFAPAGGPNPAILDNIIGLALRPNGNLLVTVTGGANDDSVAEFDTSGNYLGNFVPNDAGGMDGPFDIYRRAADWLVTNINSDEANRHDFNTGAFLDQFAPISDFPQQIAEAANGNVLVGNFSGAQVGVIEFTSAGLLVDVYAPVTGNRGAYELPNGNILTTNASGVHEIDRDGNLVETKLSGVNAQYIELVLQTPAITLNKTVGTDPGVCATTTEIEVVAETEVYYCYEVTNTGNVALDLHDLVDSELGVILNDFPYTLSPGASAFLTQSEMIVDTTINVATWTAFNPGPTDVVSATAVSTVTVVIPSITLTKTVGLDPDSCAIADNLAVPAGTAVTYCYSVTNTGTVTLTTHDLVDSELGTILDDFPLVLPPAGSAYLTQTVMITQTTVNTATWTAYTSGGQDTTASDSATVSVEPEVIEYKLYLPIVVYTAPAALPPENR